MTVELRGHHLLCILTYAGKGYTREFVENCDAVVTRLEDEDVQVVSGPDDLCRPMLASDDAHCRLDRVQVRDRRALEAISRLVGREVGVGSRLRLGRGMLSRLRHAFGAGEIRLACEGCEWSGLCTAIAQDGFRDARLDPAADA